MPRGVRYPNSTVALPLVLSVHGTVGEGKSGEEMLARIFFIAICYECFRLFDQVRHEWEQRQEQLLRLRCDRDNLIKYGEPVYEVLDFVAILLLNSLEFRLCVTRLHLSPSPGLP
jgi:hypothetical protein